MPVQGPLKVADFRPLIPKLDIARLNEVLRLASGVTVNGIGTETPSIGGQVIIPGPLIGDLGGWTTDTKKFRNWIEALWQLPENSPELSAALVGFFYPGFTNFNIPARPPRNIPAWGYWRTALKVGSIDWKGFANLQTIFGIPIEGWAGSVYCGDVVRASDLNMVPGPFTQLACQTVIPLTQAEGGNAGGKVGTQDGPPIVVGTGGGDDVLPPDVFDDDGGDTVFTDIPDDGGDENQLPSEGGPITEAPVFTDGPSTMAVKNFLTQEFFGIPAWLLLAILVVFFRSGKGR